MSANLFQIGSGWFPERKGGAEAVFYQLYEGLGREGFSVRGVVPGSSAVARGTGGRMQGFSVQGRSLPQRALAVRRRARDSFAAAPPRLVTSHFALYSLPLLDRLSRVPVVVHFHGPWATESLAEGQSSVAARCKKALESMVYRRARRIIVLSDAFGRLLQAQYGVPESIIRRVPGGVACERFAPATSRAAARRALGWDEDRPTLFVVRRLVQRMGLDRLLDAMAMLPALGVRGGEAAPVLHIAGTGPERERLEARAASLGLSGILHFGGAISDERLPLAYRAADFTLVPTAALEGFGLVAAESLAAGTPVLVTPVGGLPEVVRGLDPAMVLDGTDAPSIARGIARALSRPSILPDEVSCRSHALRHFDWRVVTPQIASVYREVL